MAGSNSHHIIEGAFKAVARALAKATAIDEKFANEIPSTKGVI
jgi:imidazoleglycerol-phosphate dehydratase